MTEKEEKKMSLFGRLQDVPETMRGHRILTGETIMVQTVTVQPKPGEVEVVPHRHNVEQIAYLMEGEAELEIETTQLKDNYYDLPDQFIGQPSEKKTIRAGDFFRIPSGALHSLRIIGTKQVTWLSIYHPVRPTYLPHAIRLESEGAPLPFNPPYPERPSVRPPTSQKK